MHPVLVIVVVSRVFMGGRMGVVVDAPVAGG